MMISPHVPPAFSQANAAPARQSVLILGDSVLAVTRWWPASLQPLWKHGYDVINEAWGCQALLGPGCPGSGGLSAVQRLGIHRSDPIDVIVVGTGYNDSNEESVRVAMKLIVREARRHNARVLWLTYHSRANVRQKSTRFNTVLRAESTHHSLVTVADWDERARNHESWFRNGGVHMNAIGGVQLGRFLASSLDELRATQSD